MLYPIEGRHTLKDWIALFWITIRPPRRILLPEQRLDKAFLTKQSLDIIERIHHGIWFDRTRERYLRVELRRRALKAICDLVLQRILLWKLNRLVDHRKDKLKV